MEPRMSEEQERALENAAEQFVAWQKDGVDAEDAAGMLDYFAEIFAAALSSGAGEAGAWQPIATAPKDGSGIMLGFNDEEMGGFVGQGRWHDEDHDGPDNMGHDAGFMDDMYDFFKCARSIGNPAYRHKGLQPTHWMPLPPAPGAAPHAVGPIATDWAELRDIAQWFEKEHQGTNAAFLRKCADRMEQLEAGSKA